MLEENVSHYINHSLYVCCIVPQKKINTKDFLNVHTSKEIVKLENWILRKRAQHLRIKCDYTMRKTVVVPISPISNFSSNSKKGLLIIKIWFKIIELCIYTIRM